MKYYMLFVICLFAINYAYADYYYADKYGEIYSNKSAKYEYSIVERFHIYYITICINGINYLTTYSDTTDRTTVMFDKNGKPLQCKN